MLTAHGAFASTTPGNCGHDFCRSCIEEWRSTRALSGRPVQCPLCRSVLLPSADQSFGLCRRLRDTIDKLFPEQIAARRRQLEDAAELSTSSACSSHHPQGASGRQLAFLNACPFSSADRYRNLSDRLLFLAATAQQALTLVSTLSATAAASAAAATATPTSDRGPPPPAAAGVHLATTLDATSSTSAALWVAAVQRQGDALAADYLLRCINALVRASMQQQRSDADAHDVSTSGGGSVLDLGVLLPTWVQHPGLPGRGACQLLALTSQQHAALASSAAALAAVAPQPPRATAEHILSALRPLPSNVQLMTQLHNSTSPDQQALALLLQLLPLLSQPWSPLALLDPSTWASAAQQQQQHSGPMTAAADGANFARAAAMAAPSGSPIPASTTTAHLVTVSPAPPTMMHVGSYYASDVERRHFASISSTAATAGLAVLPTPVAPVHLLAPPAAAGLAAPWRAGPAC